jgi:virulence-associated protein VapD
MFGIKNKKIKVGIFGDSYADCVERDSSNAITSINYIGWPNILANDSSLDVENYAKNCTSIFYSYKKFYEHRDKFDTIIFVITQGSRLYFSNEDILISNLSTIEQLIKNLNLQSQPHSLKYKQYLAAKMYYEYLHEPEFSDYVRDKLIEDIINICKIENKKLILIPAFSEDIKNIKYFNVSLDKITIGELKSQFGRTDYVIEKHKNRACHLSKTNNEILARLLTEIINGKELVVTINDFEFTKVSDPENYWILG